MAAASACHGPESSPATPDSALPARRARRITSADSGPRPAPRRQPGRACAGDMAAPRESWQRLDLNRIDGWKVPHNRLPRVTTVGRAVNLPARGAKIHAARFQRVNGHGIAQYIDVAILLRQSFRQRLPLVSTGPAAIHPQFSVRREMLGIALDGDDVNGFRFMRVNVNRKTEVRRQIAADVSPHISGVVAPQYVPVLLHEQNARARRMHGDAVNAMAHFRIRVRKLVRGL